jgi:hypothetical protein
VTTITSSGSSAIRGSMFWPGLTTRGALIGGFLGLISAVVMVVLSKAVWVQAFGFGQALFPYNNPVLDGDWLRRVLVGLRVGQKRGSFDGESSIPSAVCEIADRPWNSDCGQALNGAVDPENASTVQSVGLPTRLCLVPGLSGMDVREDMLW